MSRLVKNSISRSVRYSMLMAGISLLVGCLGCVFVMVPLYFVMESGASPWVVIIPVAIFILLVFGGSLAGAAILLKKRSKKLDDIFLPLGLKGSSYHIGFRQYHGTWKGRQLDVYFYRNPVIEINLSTSLKTRLGMSGPVFDTAMFASLFGKKSFKTSKDILQDLMAFPLDENWTSQLLANDEAAMLVEQLILSEGSYARQYLILRPNNLGLQLSGSSSLFTIDITSKQVNECLENLLSLLEIAESLPSPQITAEISAAEELSLSLRKKNWVAISIGVAAGVLVLIVGGGILIAAVILLLNP